MENKIELTPAEVEMIQLQREKQETEAKEKALKQQIEREKDIKNKKKEIDKFKIKQQEQNHQTEMYLEQFNKINPGKYFLVKKEREQKFECYDWVGKTWDNKEIYFSETVKYVEFIIKRQEFKNEPYRGEVEVIYEERSRYRETKYGWLMRYNCKEYKIAKTIDTKIQESINEINRGKREAEAKLTAKETVLKILTERYPNEKIEYKEEYHFGYHSHYKRHSTSGYYTHYYIITFKNGLQIKFQYYNDGSIGNGVIVNDHKFDFDTLVNFMKTLKIVEKEV